MGISYKFFFVIFLSLLAEDIEELNYDSKRSKTGKTGSSQIHVQVDTRSWNKTWV